MIKILLIEDLEETREVIKEALNNSEHRILEAENIREGMEKIQREKPQIILLDLNLPDGSGTGICQEIKKDQEKYGNPFIIAISSDTEQDTINFCLRIGCDDYIRKPIDLDELFLRIDKYIQRVHKPGKIINYREIKLFLENRLVIWQGKKIELSKNEFELLTYLILNKGILLSREAILNRVWENNFEISDKAVDQCLKRMKKKLPYLGEYLQPKRGIGYILM